MKSTLALLLLGSLGFTLHAQTSAGTVSGTVRDQSGASVPTGFYRFPGVIPRQHRLTVESAGMQKFEGSVAVQVGQSVVVDAVLQPAGTTTVVDVQAVATMVTTDSPTIGSVMERQRGEPARIWRTARVARVCS